MAAPTFLELVARMVSLAPITPEAVQKDLGVSLSPNGPLGGVLDKYRGGMGPHGITGVELRRNDRGAILIVSVDGPPLANVATALMEAYGTPEPSIAMGETPPDYPQYYTYRLEGARLSIAYGPQEPNSISEVIIDRFPQ